MDLKEHGKNLIKAVGKSLKGILVALLCIVIIAFILWPFGYKVDFLASIFKILDKFVVFYKVENPPNIQLFSQYPYEYKIDHPKGWVTPNEILQISNKTKPLWLGVYNLELRTLHSVRFILFPPETAKIYNEDEWGGAWLIAGFGTEQKTQCQYRYEANISPHTGWVIPVPIQFEFPQTGKYEFSYVIISDDYTPYKNSFIIDRVK